MDLCLLVVYVMYCFDMGGLENGVVNLINYMLVYVYWYVVVVLIEIIDFCQCVQWDDVEFIVLNKVLGQGFWFYLCLFWLFCWLCLVIVYSCNIGVLEVQLFVWVVGVFVCVYGEYGWDVSDMDGSCYCGVCCFYKFFVSCWIVLLCELGIYLQEQVCVFVLWIMLVCNGVNID